MAHIFGRGLLFAAILMFGFILGIVYSNHVQVDPDNILAKKEKEPKEEESVPVRTTPGIVFKEVEDYKIKMEDGDGLVIYDHDDEEIRKDLVKDVDLQRDLMDKTLYANSAGRHNFFSQMGLRTADAFEGAFRSFFSLMSH
ncbi:hypothetical protein J2S74_001712 [Evansella vedderi]|uniref:Uncharacterized protein n=1 Tax=Evansella vedderi TaxID=38282 RepID=A0ABT9ZUD2_9BACI|nr:hypothetical protein [Evansella vedderi]MDQ0254337.1 hypothetical protein [Evansella vedderi]